jgi:uncharacterized membrane protein YuzA (DUF378 family)
MEGNTMDMVAMIFVLIGGINWGLYGLFQQMDFIDIIFGSIPMLATLVYALIGLSALYVGYKEFLK